MNNSYGVLFTLLFCFFSTLTHSFSKCCKRKKPTNAANPINRAVVPVQGKPLVAQVTVTTGRPPSMLKEVTAKTDLRTQKIGNPKVEDEKGKEKTGTDGDKKGEELPVQDAEPNKEGKKSSNNEDKKVVVKKDLIKNKKKPLEEHTPVDDPEPDPQSLNKTQPSESQKIGYDDDTVKHIESIKADNHASED